MKSKIFTYIQPRILIGFVIIFSVLIFLSSYWEYRQIQKEQYDLIKNQVHTILETTSIASENTILGNWLLEEEIEKRLLAACLTAKEYFEANQLDEDKLKLIASHHGLFRILIADDSGNIIQSNQWSRVNQKLPDRVTRQLQRFLSSGMEAGSGDYFESNIPGEFRYAFFYRLTPKKVIIVNVDAKTLLNFRKQTGFGSLIEKITANKNIVYAALQDTSGIIAASKNIRNLDKIETKEHLMKSFINKSFEMVETEFEGQPILEAVHPLLVEGELIGLFRIGISYKPLWLVQKQSLNRVLISSIMVLVLGGFLVIILLAQQHVALMKRQYQEVETFSQNILTQISDGVLILNEKNQIVLLNQFFSQLAVSAEELTGKIWTAIFPESLVQTLSTSPSGLSEVELEINDQQTVWMISKHNILVGESPFQVFVVRDVTDKYRMEEQIKRRERLAAMGQLASGVAHEIRNPLNAIATLAQQVNSDFDTTSDNHEFHQLMDVIQKEVIRLNNTVEHFLKLARPEPLQIKTVKLAEFILELEHQFKFAGTGKNLTIVFANEYPGDVRWDSQKMKQVLINLINNAMEACHQDGYVRITFKQFNEKNLHITVQDNGIGMDEETKKKIFNAYFTTRSDGTGLGLSIVQQVIDLHNGSISVCSKKGEGTVFEIKLPVIPPELQEIRK